MKKALSSEVVFPLKGEMKGCAGVVEGESMAATADGIDVESMARRKEFSSLYLRERVRRRETVWVDGLVGVDGLECERGADLGGDIGGAEDGKESASEAGTVVDLWSGHGSGRSCFGRSVN